MVPILHEQTHSVCPELTLVRENPHELEPDVSFPARGSDSFLVGFEFVSVHEPLVIGNMDQVPRLHEEGFLAVSGVAVRFSRTEAVAHPRAARVRLP